MTAEDALDFLVFQSVLQKIFLRMFLCVYIWQYLWALYLEAEHASSPLLRILVAPQLYQFTPYQCDSDNIHILSDVQMFGQLDMCDPVSFNLICLILNI